MSDPGTRIQYVQKTVLVTRNGSQLTIDPQEFALENGTWVEWVFEGLQPGEYAFISFAPPAPRLGPFYSLRSLDDKRFLGKGHKKIGGENLAGGSYAYRALILAPTQSDAVASGVGMVTNCATQENTSPEIRVKYSEVKDGQGQVIDHVLEVKPDPVGLNWGDTATWVFEDLPANAFPFFQFNSLPEPPEEPPGIGPFVAFNASTSLQDSSARASAMGFAVYYPDPNTYPSFTYHIELRDWEGKLLASHDPAIDNLGPPPPPD
jgi:hypothetical protein